MHPNLKLSLDRADELLRDLLAEYDRSLQNKQVSSRAIQITHGVCERLRSILDRVAHLYWQEKVAPQLTEEDRNAAAVYFPIASDQNSLDSILGRWRWKPVRDQHQRIYEFLHGLQPFVSDSNRWLAILNDLAVQGKHIDLVPQKRTEQRVTTVTRLGVGAIRHRGVRFSRGIRIMGAPVDPATQRIMPTPGVTETVELWVSFEIQGYGVNAASFADNACRKVRYIATEISTTFDLHKQPNSTIDR